MRRDVSKHDLECYQYLFNIIDHQLLSYIEYPDRDVEFFRLLHHAVEAAVIFYNYICNFFSEFGCVVWACT